MKNRDDTDYDSILSLKDTKIPEHIESLDWCCMNCGFIVSGVEYNRILCNPVCECGEYRWSDYVIKRYKTKENMK